jgi:phage tail-like protein
MANTQFVVNSYRYDPYLKNFFRLKMDGRYVMGINKIGALKQSTEPISHREGGDPSTSRMSPGLWKYDSIVIERGVTHDLDFENWAKLVWNVQSNALISLKDFRKDIIIEMLNEQGTIVKVYNVYRCWVSEYTALPELDAATGGIAIEHMVIQNEGWDRDVSILEPRQR